MTDERDQRDMDRDVAKDTTGRDVAEAVLLWKEDATRAATSLDPERVLARARETAGEAQVAARTARRYVSAAAVLLALGAGGTAWLAVAEPPAGVRPDLALDGLERERVELQGAFELLALPVANPATKGG